MIEPVAYIRGPYKGRRSVMRLRIRTDGIVVASAPARISDAELTKFVQAHQEWIEKKKESIARKKSQIVQIGTGTKAEYGSLKDMAYAVAQEHVARIRAHHSFSPKKITIRNQKTRWGSCSSNGALAFNYRIALLPYELAEYLVVHELCHLREMNHSHQFWSHVEAIVPDWKRRRRLLHRYGLSEQ
jgi:predicted metal-dependent hydrolase